MKRKLLLNLSINLGLILLCGGVSTLAFCRSWFRLPNTEVVVSACEDMTVKDSEPSGQMLWIRELGNEEEYLLNQYFLDLRTGERKPVPAIIYEHFEAKYFRGKLLTPDLVWLEGSYHQPDDVDYKPHFILDLRDGNRYPLLDLTWHFSNKRLENGELHPDLLAYFLNAEQVFISREENRVIALASDFHQYPERNVIFSQYSLGSNSLDAKNGELLEQLMTELGVDYQILDVSLYYAGIPSPSGNFVVRNDAIYLADGDIPILEKERGGFGGYFKGWYYDDSGIVVIRPTRYLFSGPLFEDGSVRILKIPQPVLKLRLPEEYLPSPPIP